MPWGAAIVAGGAILGGAISSHGAQSAADTQAGAATHAADIGKQEFDTITQQEQPYMQAGYGALSQLNYLLGNPQTQTPSAAPTSGYDPSSGWTMLPDGTMMPRMVNANQGMTPGGQSTVSPVTSSPAGSAGSLLKPFSLSDFYNFSPAYQFQKQQGTQGVLNANASGQGSLSGAAQKDLIDYNQSLASSAFGNAFNQYQTQQGNIFNRLSGIAQLGQTAAANTGQQGTALTGQIGQSITNAGTAAAAGQVGSANAWSGALSSAAPWLAGAASRWGGGGGGTDWAAQAAAAGVS